MKYTSALLAISVAAASAQRISSPRIIDNRHLEDDISSIAKVDTSSIEMIDSGVGGSGNLGTKSAKFAKSSKPTPTCGPSNFNGNFRYMATTGGNGGKSYTVTVNYDPATEKQEGLFVIFADGMSNGNYLKVIEDDSAFIRFTEDNFAFNDDGQCTFSFPRGGFGDSDILEFMKCPLICAANATLAPDSCPGNPKVEEEEPNCSFTVEAVQVSDNTWSLDFPPFPTGARRLATRN